jgi:nicotinate-nucleotide adenylyltransferase
MGSDSFCNIKKWKNYEILLKQYGIILYKRPGFEPDLSLSSQVEVVQAPLLDISSTYIRGLIQQKKSIRYLVTDEVSEDIKANGYYSK